MCIMGDEKMSDLISRQDVLAVLCFSQETGQMVCGDLRKLLEEIKAIPSAEPAERTAKVEWSEVDGCHLCGECGFAVTPNCDVYCAGCGARLEWE